MASRIKSPAPNADATLETLTQLLRDLFATAAAPPPKASTKKVAAPTEDDEDEDEDESDDLMPPMLPMGMGPGKGMRRVTISILMPAKGTRPK